MSIYRRKSGGGHIEAREFRPEDREALVELLTWINGGQKPERMPPGLSWRCERDPAGEGGPGAPRVWILAFADQTRPIADMLAYPGDMIVKFGPGCFEPMQPRAFARHYEPAPEPVEV